MFVGKKKYMFNKNLFYHFNIFTVIEFLKYYTDTIYLKKNYIILLIYIYIYVCVWAILKIVNV